MKSATFFVISRSILFLMWNNVDAALLEMQRCIDLSEMCFLIAENKNKYKL